MKLVLALLVATSTCSGPVHASPTVAAPTARADEQITLIPVGELDDGQLDGPPIVRGHAPSTAHPRGTVYVYATRDNSISLGRPYVFEWDVASGRVVHAALGTAGTLATDGDVDFDGKHVVTLDRRGDFGVLTVFDETLQRVRSRHVDANVERAVLGNGRIALVGHEEGERIWTTVELLDASLHRIARRRFPGVRGNTMDDQRLAHAGDSFYALGSDPKTHHAFVLRLDDRTLQERRRSVFATGAEITATLQATDDHVVVFTGSEFLDHDLALTQRRRTPGSAMGRWAWSPAQILVADHARPGSRIWTTCTPRWAFGHAVYACRGPNDFAMVRPSAAALQSLEPALPVP